MKIKFIFALLFFNLSYACHINIANNEAHYQIRLQGDSKKIQKNCQFINERVLSIINKFLLTSNIQLQNQELFENGEDVLSIQIQQIRLPEVVSGQILINLFTP